MIVLEGPSAGKKYRLSRMTSLGSAEDNTIIIGDKRVPPYCVNIQRKAKGYKITSLVANKPVKINGEYVRQDYLSHGDILTLAGCTLLYTEEEGKLANTYEYLNVPIDELERKDSPLPLKVLLEINPRQYSTALLHDGYCKNRLHTLFNVNTAISEIRDLDELSNKILEIIFEEFPADQGFILIVNPDKKREIKASRQRNRNSCSSSFPPGYLPSITEKVLVEKISMLFNTEIDGTEVSCVCVPLSSKENLLGLVQLENASGYQFSQEDLEQLRKIAMQAALAVENVQTHKQPVHYRQQLITLQYFTQSLSSHMDKDTIIREAVGATTSLFKCSRASISLLEHQEYLRLAFAIGLAPGWENTRIPLHNSVVGKVLLKNKPLLIHDTTEIPVNLRSSLLGHKQYKAQSCILSPIPKTLEVSGSKKRAVGVICATEKLDKAVFTVLDRYLLSLLANQVGIALRNAELYEKSTIDSLTKVYSRGYFFQRLQEEMGNQQPLSVLMLDLDHFKEINDTYTHQIGDSFLQQMGELLTSLCQEGEIVGRYGGEEFMIMIPSDRETAIQRAQKIRLELSKYPFSTGTTEKNMTTSIGLAFWRENDAVQLLMERADKALYLAKKWGRNQVVNEQDLDKYEELGKSQERLA